MSVFTAVVLIVAIVLSLAVLAWFFFQRSNPEDRNTHRAPGDRPEPTKNDRFYDLVDRPAGPDAEAMDPERLGGDHRPPR